MPQNTSTFISFVESLETRFNELCKDQNKQELLSIFRNNEAAYYAKLLSLINIDVPIDNNTLFKGDIICCIDPRERNVRTILESFFYKTYGYSGWLGLPLFIVDAIEDRTYQSCPGWIIPEHTVRVDYDKNKKIELSFDVEIPFEKQYQYALQLCKTIGLKKSRAPFIIFMGHKGELLDFKYKEQLLHCGACEGNPGEINNRVMAQILQSPEIKKALRDDGIDISDQTICVAAEHNTNTGEIILLTELNEATQGTEYGELLDTFKKTTEEYLKQKLQYSGFKSASELLQPSPFVSLAGNKGMLIGPLEILGSLDQKEKYFLQSYEYNDDSEGTTLKNILTGPLRVALSINISYLFSTIALQNNKNITNIPSSLIFDAQNIARHELMRFFVIIYAPYIMVKNLIDNNLVLQILIKNEWMNVISIDSKSKDLISIKL